LDETEFINRDSERGENGCEEVTVIFGSVGDEGEWGFKVVEKSVDICKEDDDLYWTIVLMNYYMRDYYGTYFYSCPKEMSDLGEWDVVPDMCCSFL
jgi:hypothetical protein